MHVTRRAVAYITGSCNVACEFCYFRFDDPTGPLPLGKFEAFLRRLRGVYDVDFVDLTGGEPTIHPDIVDIVKACAREGVRATIITNGQKPDLVEPLLDAGLEDALVSVHGDQAVHDRTVRREGAYRRLVATTEAMHRSGFTFRTNTVLTRYACDRVEELVDSLLSLSPRMVNLISFNPHNFSKWKDRSALPFQASYSEQALAAKVVVERLSEEGIWVNVRYLPLCLMKGFEAHVCNFRQLPYDPYEWDYVASNELAPSEVESLTCKAVAAGVFGLTDRERLYNYIADTFVRDNQFPRICTTCGALEACDRPSGQYLAAFGDLDLEPYSGIRASDPMYFRRHDSGWAKLK